MIDDPLLTWKGRRVRSPGDGPEAIARKVPAAPLRPGSLFFVPSPLEGWGIDVLLDRLPEEGAVVVFEKDEELEGVCAPQWAQFWANRPSDPRLFRLAADTEEAVQDLFRALPLARLRRCEFLTLNGAWLAHGPRYREVFQRLQEGLTRWWSNRMTCLHLGPLWVRNFLDNLEGDRFPGTPWPHWGAERVLVCGAGVSLEAALPEVVRNRATWKLVAADTALPVLKAWNLVPDAVVCLEAQQANLRDFSGWVGEPVLLFTDLTSHPGSTRVFGPPPCWFITEFTELALWERWPWADVPRLPPLGSVGVAAAWVAWRLSAGPVVLAGLDFSFPVAKTHARGTPTLQELAARTSRFRGMEQPGSWLRPGLRPVDHGPWVTTPVLQGYAGVLADQARSHRHRTWVWDLRGLPLGLTVWDAAPVTAGPANDSQSPRPTAPPQAKRRAWIEEEQALWERILELFVQINRDLGDEAAWSELERALRSVDYLTFTFPDPEFRRSSDWLIRAQVQVRWALSRRRRS